MSPGSNAENPGAAAAVGIPLPGSSQSDAAAAGVPVASSHCAPVIGSTNLLNGSSAGALLSGITRFVSAVAKLQFTKLLHLDIAFV